jgi:hypothetical protein
MYSCGGRRPVPALDTIGLDVARNSFHVHSIGATENVVSKKQRLPGRVN